MKCNEISELLSLYIDRMLDESQAREVEAHLSFCEACRIEYQEMKEMLDLLGQTELLPVPDAFSLRMKQALKEEKQNMIAAGIIAKSSKKNNKWRIFTSIAAVVAVGVITMSLYEDVLGILPDRMNGEDQASIAATEEFKDAPAKKEKDETQNSAGQDSTSDGSVVMKSQTDELQPMSVYSGSGAAVATENNETGSESDAAAKRESATENPETVYGLADGSLPESEAGNDLGSGSFSVNNKLAAPSEDECSRSLTASGVERNTAAIQFYKQLIEARLDGFDYQILESSYTTTGEWLFRVFIFRGKDGNTYNEEIRISGKDGEIEIICSNEFMGL